MRCAGGLWCLAVSSLALACLAAVGRAGAVCFASHGIEIPLDHHFQADTASMGLVARDIAGCGPRVGSCLRLFV